MYIGRTDQPRCLRDDPKTVTRIAASSWAVTFMENAVPIMWHDIVGDVTFQFCGSDWKLATELVLDLGMHPFPRCNVARADFSIREDFEALLNNTRDEPDQTEQEDCLPTEARVVIDDTDDPMIEERDLVKTHIVARAMAELGVDRSA